MALGYILAAVGAVVISLLVSMLIIKYTTDPSKPRNKKAYMATKWSAIGIMAACALIVIGMGIYYIVQ